MNTEIDISPTHDDPKLPEAFYRCTSERCFELTYPAEIMSWWDGKTVETDPDVPESGTSPVAVQEEPGWYCDECVSHFRAVSCVSMATVISNSDIAAREPSTDDNIMGYLPADDYNASLMTKDGAVERWIEDFFDDISEDYEWTTRCLPDTITITAFRRPKLDIGKFNPLEFVLEELDEEYADPEDIRGADATPAMIEAEKEFLKIVLDEYSPWRADKSHHVTVNLADWIRECHPQWLEESRFAHLLQ